MDTTALILAAGKGTRMRSAHPKVTHELLGRPLVNWSIEIARQAGCDNVVCVLGHGIEEVSPLVGDVDVVVQQPQLGTGHAVMCARGSIGETGSLVVLSGDSPLIRPETIAGLVRLREERGAGAVILTMEPADPYGYGRIIRDGDEVEAIVEQRDCSPEQALVRECNSGVYCFDTASLLGVLDELTTDNAQSEYYLTDCIGLIRSRGEGVLGMLVDDATEALGVNSRAQLAEATRIMQERINLAHMDAGVTMLDPLQVWIGPEVTIEQDVELLPQTYLMGSTHVASESVIGPNTRLTDCVVGRGCTVDETVAVESRIDDAVSCGPRAYLRSGTHICSNAHIGTHVELKKSVVGEGSKVPHLSYIGDAVIGAETNIGAGAITCNYDGFRKHPTTIGSGAFIGSDTMLVAPVTIGDGAVIGAGSTITRDVPAGALGIERGDQTNIEGWAKKHFVGD